METATQERSDIRERDGIIEYIAEGGIGSEARINIELRTRFPGIGGTILTSEGAVSALREEFHPNLRAGHYMFLRHLIIKKLEDYFFRIQIYKVSHIPRPFGSISREGKNGEEPYEAYLYEWVYGDEGFAWQLPDDEGNPSLVTLRDWNAFIGVFGEAGVDLMQDCTDPDDGRMSKNIIYQFSRRPGTFELSSIWKRIDFGFRSISINYERLGRFIADNRKKLVSVLRSERYEMIELALECLTTRGCMGAFNMGKLEILVGDYRRATLGHYISRGSGTYGNGVRFGERTESLM